MKLKTILMSSVYAFAVSGVILATIPTRSFADDDRRYDRKQREENRRYERKEEKTHRKEIRNDKRDHRDYRPEHRDRRDYRYEHRERRDYRYEHRDRDYRTPRIIHRGHVYRVPETRIRHYRNVVVLRPYGHWYSGYGHHHIDGDAWRWLAFTAITLKILDNLNEQQQREHEAAQIRATTAPIGERIYWNRNGASGYVTPVREGTSTSGRYCREFQQQVNIGGRIEQAYGTACRNPDGSWEVVSTENR